MTEVSSPVPDLTCIMVKYTTWPLLWSLKSSRRVRETTFKISSWKFIFKKQKQRFKVLSTFFPAEKPKKLAEITSPRMSEVFPVDLGELQSCSITSHTSIHCLCKLVLLHLVCLFFLGSTVVIDCQAVAYSEFDEVFWLMDGSFVKRDSSLPVFYNFTQ